jgi:hypothetical protein
MTFTCSGPGSAARETGRGWALLRLWIAFYGAATSNNDAGARPVGSARPGGGRALARRRAGARLDSARVEHGPVKAFRGAA